MHRRLQAGVTHIRVYFSLEVDAEKFEWYSGNGLVPKPFSVRLSFLSLETAWGLLAKKFREVIILSSPRHGGCCTDQLARSRALQHMHINITRVPAPST